MQKIILVDTDSSLTSVRHIADGLNRLCDLKIAERFNSGLDDQIGISLDFKEVVVAYKNNAIFSCITDINNVTTGITMDEYYNSNVIYLSVAELMNVPDHKLTNCIIVWIDSDKLSCSTEDISIATNMEKIIHSCEYLYFLKNELDKVITIICRYIDGDIEERQNILEENS